jgi:hypothetical protein
LDGRSGSGAPASKASLFPPASGLRRTPLHPKVRGTIIREEMRSARTLASDAAVEEALARLAPEVAVELRDVIAIAWCSLASVRAFHEAMAAVLKEDPTVWHLRVVEHATQEMFSTTWRFVLRLTSPEALVRRTSSMYARIFDTGKMEAFIVAPGHSIARLTGWPEPHAFHLDGVATGIVTVLRLAKIESVRAHWHRTPDGADFELRTAPRS